MPNRLTLNNVANSKQAYLDQLADFKKQMLGAASSLPELATADPTGFDSLQDYESSHGMASTGVRDYFRRQQREMSEARHQASIDQQREREANAWAKDHEMGSPTGVAKQAALRYASGALRTAGELTSLPFNTAAVLRESGIDQRAFDIYSRERQYNNSLRELQDNSLALRERLQAGEINESEYNQERLRMEAAMLSLERPTDEELDYLDAREPLDANRSHLTRGLDLSYAPKDAPNTYASHRERIERYYSALETAGSIREYFTENDFAKKLNPLNTDSFHKDLADVYEQEKHHFAEAQELWNNDNKAGAVAKASMGVAKLIKEAAPTVLNNKAATFEYIAENIPQIQLGAAAPVLLAASNAGYAASIYEQAVQDFAEDNDGALPNANQRALMLGISLTAGAFEHAGEALTVRNFRKLTGLDPTELSQGVLATSGRVVRAGAANTVVEGATEMYQTAVEENLSRLNTDFDGANIYTAGVIGAASGGSLATYGRAVSEVTRTTPEHADDNIRSRENREATQKLHTEAVKTGDVSALIDESKPATYSPALAATALITRINDTTLPESARDEARQKLAEVREQIDDDISSLESAIQDTTDEGKESLKAQINQVNAALEAETLSPDRREDLTVAIELLEERLSIAEKATKKEIRNNERKLERLMDNVEVVQRAFDSARADELQATPESIDAAVEEAASATEADQQQESANRAITLMMANPMAITPETAKKFADSPAFTPEQQAFLRQHGEAREAVDELKDIAGVSANIFQGDDQYKGLPQYQQDVARAVRDGRQAQAQLALDGITQFATGHRSKANAANQALAIFRESGQPAYITRGDDPNQGWAVTTQRPSVLKRGRVLKIDGGSARLVNTINTEAAAIEAVQSEIQAAVDLLGSAVPVSRATQETAPTTEPDAATNPEVTDDVVEDTQEAPAVAQEESAPTETAPLEQEAVPTEVYEAEAVSDTAEATNNEVADATQVEAVPTEPTALEQEATPNDVIDPVGEVEGTQAQTETETTDVEEEADTGGKLEVLKRSDSSIEGPVNTETYQSKNLIVEYFEQSAGSAKAATLRPLAAVKDFLSKWEETPGLFQKFWSSRATDLDGTAITARQSALLKDFRQFARWAAPRIRANANRPNFNPKHANKDYVQFLFRDTGFDENVLTAIAYGALRWVIDNGFMQGRNTPEDVKRMFGMTDSDTLSDTAYATLSDVGVREKYAVQEMGRNIREALGLKAKKTAPREVEAELELALGAQALAVLLESDLIEEASIKSTTISDLILRDSGDSGTDMADLLGQALPTENPNARATEYFIKPRNNNSVNAVIEASRNTGSILDKIFGTEAGLREPTLEPVPFKQPTTRRRGQKIPKDLKDRVNKHNSREWGIRQHLSKIRAAVGDAVFLATMGQVDTTKPMLDILRIKAEASNQARILNLERLTDFESRLAELGDASTSFYLSNDVWSMQRVGEHSNVIRPQGDKMHREMVGLKSWKTQVDPTKESGTLTNFKLAVAQSLGVDTDKQPIETSLAKFEALLNDDFVQAGLEAFRNILAREGDEVGADPSEVEAILDVQKRIGAKEGYLNGMYNLLQYHDALKTGTPFEADIAYSVDGVTNGPALAHILMGLLDNNNAGYFGFYPIGAEQSDYPTYRDQGNADLYETVVQSAHRVLSEIWQQRPKWRRFMSAVGFFTGGLLENEKVSGNGRNWFKQPTTATTFGSSINSLPNGIADTFIEKVYEKISDSLDSRESLNRALTELNKLIWKSDLKVDENMSVERAIKLKFNTKQIAEIQRSVELTLGNAAKTAIQSKFGEFTRRRDKLNQAAKSMFAMYKYAYEQEKKRILDARVDADKAAMQGKHYRQDITDQEDAQIHENLGRMFPLVHTALSLSSGERDAGLFPSKRVNRYKRASTGAYTQEITFGRDIPDNQGGTLRTRRLSALVSEHGDPGVSLVIMLVHAMDSAIASKTYAEYPSLNVHDALVMSLNDVTAGSVAFNRNAFRELVNYSLPMQISEAWERTYKEFSQQYGHDDNAIQFVRKSMRTTDSLQSFHSDLTTEALRMEHEKLTALLNVGYVNQYAFEGGSYVVTAKDRQLIQEKLNAIEGFNHVRAAKPNTETVVDTPWGRVGIPLIASDMGIVGALRSDKKHTVKSVMPMLMRRLKDEPENQHLLEVAKLLKHVVNPDMEIVLVTPETPADKVPDNVDRARGWYTIGDNTIYVKSPEFVNSGLTAETLLHEMVHAAVAHTIETRPNDPAVQELKKILEEARRYAKQHNLTFAEELSSVHELVAWGMTNRDFQRNVLEKITITSDSADRSQQSGFRAFIRNIVKALFGNRPQRIQNLAENGLTVLIANTTMLMEPVQESPIAEPVTLLQAIPNPMNFSTEQVFEALGRVDNTARSPVHTQRLRNILDQVVNTAYGAFELDKAPAERRAATTAEDTFLNHLATGQTPFVSKARRYMDLSLQEAFVLDSVEVTINEAINSSMESHRELRALFHDAAKVVTPQDLFDGDWNAATAAERDNATQLHKSIFTATKDEDGTSSYLARFAAVALVSPQLYKRLGDIAPRTQTPSYAGMNITQRIVAWFSQALARLRYRLAGVNALQTGDERLTSLASKLAQIEVKRKADLQRRQDRPDSVLEKAVAVTSQTVRGNLEKFGKSAFFRKSGNAFVRASGGVISTVAGNRGETLVNGFMKMSDSIFKERRGLMASILKEAMGIEEFMQRQLMLANKHQKQREEVRSGFAQSVQDGFGRKLTDVESKAMTYGVLRTGLANLLGPFSMIQIEEMFNSSEARQAAIKDLESRLQGIYVDELKVNAKALAYYMAQGEVTSDFMKMNAHSIAFMAGTEQQLELTDTQAKDNEKVLRQLVSAYAIEYQTDSTRTLVANVMASERARGEGQNGVEALISIHRALQEQSKKTLFNDNPMQMFEGYTKEIFDPYVDVRVAEDQDSANELLAAGYEEVGELHPDPNDVRKYSGKLFIARDAGLNDYVTGAISMTGKRHKGTAQYGGASRVVNGNVITDAGANNQVVAQRVQNAVNQRMKQKPGYGDSFDPRQVAKRPGNKLVPILSESGQLAGFRYLMNNDMKDRLLSRENQVDKVVGMTAANIFDKHGSEQVNRDTIQALKTWMDKDYPYNPEAYIEFGPNSTDATIRENYRLLPEATKQAIRDIWGKDQILISRDLLDTVFGYRKFSFADPFTLEGKRRRADRNLSTTKRKLIRAAEAVIIENAEEFFGPKLGRRIRQTEEIWQTLVREAKDNIVIKTAYVLFDNILSNMFVLFALDVPITDIVKNTVIGYTRAMEYDRHRKELLDLNIKLDAGYGITDIAAARSRVVELEDAMARNPVHELMEAGVMQTIIEDVDQTEDPYSYKSRLVEKLEAKTQWIPREIKTVGKWVYMGKGTPMYDILSHATQMSDFVARYTLHQHMTTRKNPMSNQDSINLAMAAFVNYDIPTHRSVQYLNDMGFLWFTKYYVRIQRMILHLFQKEPARALALLVMNNYIAEIPTILDSSILDSDITNRFGSGFLEFPGTLDDLATVKLAMLPWQ